MAGTSKPTKFLENVHCRCFPPPMASPHRRVRWVGYEDTAAHWQNSVVRLVQFKHDTLVSVSLVDFSDSKLLFR